MIRAFFDGACEPMNPGGTIGFGAVIFDAAGREIWSASGMSRPEDGPGLTTSNLAEYAGLLAALWGLIELNCRSSAVEICGDSKLVIEQMTGRWALNDGAYASAAREAQQLIEQFRQIRFRWVPRQQNERADALSKAKITEAGIKIRRRAA
jgi:ribonuclease HI